jgi:hypothetical protein
VVPLLRYDDVDTKAADTMNTKRRPGPLILLGDATFFDVESIGFASCSCCEQKVPAQTLFRSRTNHQLVGPTRFMESAQNLPESAKLVAKMLFVKGRPPACGSNALAAHTSSLLAAAPARPATGSRLIRTVDSEVVPPDSQTATR